MPFVDTSKLSQKIISLFSDNRLTDSEWYYSVPLHVIQTALPVLININHFTNGMKRNMQIYGIEIPEVKQYPPKELLAERPELADWNFYDPRDVERLLNQSAQEQGDINPRGLG